MSAEDGALDGVARPGLSEAVAGAIARGSKTIDGMEAGLREALITIEAAVTRSHKALGVGSAAVALIDAVEEQLGKARRQAADRLRQTNVAGWAKGLISVANEPEIEGAAAQPVSPLQFVA